MTILLAPDQPAHGILAGEGIPVADPARFHGDALRIAVLNLMPTKVATEIQLSRVLAGTGHAVHPVWFHPASHRGHHTDAAHLDRFYQPADRLADGRWDALLVTGAPVETLPWEAVDYWDELRRLLDHAAQEIPASLFICWGAQAALQHYHGIGKRALPAKHSGVFRHHLHRPLAPLVLAHDDEFTVPVSRFTESDPLAIATTPNLRVLASSPETGHHLAWEATRRRTYLFNHPEYDQDTLDREYRRDLGRGLAIQAPRHYYTAPDEGGLPGQLPPVTWRAHAHLVYGNWVRSEIVHSVNT